MSASEEVRSSDQQRLPNEVLNLVISHIDDPKFLWYTCRNVSTTFRLFSEEHYAKRYLLKHGIYLSADGYLTCPTTGYSGRISWEPFHLQLIRVSGGANDECEATFKLSACSPRTLGYADPNTPDPSDCVRSARLDSSSGERPTLKVHSWHATWDHRKLCYQYFEEIRGDKSEEALFTDVRLMPGPNEDEKSPKVVGDRVILRLEGCRWVLPSIQAKVKWRELLRRSAPNRLHAFNSP